MTEKHAALHYAVIEAYRTALLKRYNLENLRTHHDLDGVSTELLQEVQDFFLIRLYPPSEKRKILDDAFDRLGDVLSSPKKILPLVGTAGRSIFKLGFLIPSAIQGAFHTLETYLDIRKIEKEIITHANKAGLGPEDMADENRFNNLILALPEKNIIHFRRETIKLFKALSNIKLLKISLKILDESKLIMESRTDLYLPQELAGLNFGHEMMEAGVHLYEKITPDLRDLIHEGIEKIEIDWYEGLKKTRN